jgi:hypothetical protein
MRVIGLSLVGVLALIVPIAAHANEPGSVMAPANSGPAPGIVLAWDGGGSERRSGAVGAHPTASRTLQWNDGRGPPHWGPNRYYGGWGLYGGPAVPTYWVWGPSGGAFDYPFADWRGPTGGWGNP